MGHDTDWFPTHLELLLHFLHNILANKFPKLSVPIVSRKERLVLVSAVGIGDAAPILVYF